MNRLINTLGKLSIVGWCAFLIYQLSCDVDRSPSNGRVLQKIEAPDGLIDAIFYMHEGGGATVGNSFSIYLSRKGMFPDEYSEVFFVTRPESLIIKWERNRFLKIFLDHGHIHHFRNFWFSNRIDGPGYFVEMRLEIPDSVYAITELN